MSKNIYLSGGSKGGVGKSIVTMATIDYLVAHKEHVVLCETDTTNPDVFKCYQHHENVTVKLINLDESDGWIELLNQCDENAEKIFVINTAARNNKGVVAYSETLKNTLHELKRKLITLWVINRQRDSLELLKEYIDALPFSDTHQLHVLRNSYFGNESKFELYNNSNIRKQVEQSGGKSLTFPDVSDRVSDDLYSQRLSIAKAIKEFPIGNRAELLRWRNAVGSLLKEVINV